MKIRLRYFGMIAERLGLQTEEVDCNDRVVVEDLRAWLIGLHPQLSTMSWKIAVDQELVEGACDLHDGSEIVLLPPFAGG